MIFSWQIQNLFKKMPWREARHGRGEVKIQKCYRRFELKGLAKASSSNTATKLPKELLIQKRLMPFERMQKAAVSLGQRALGFPGKAEKFRFSVDATSVHEKTRANFTSCETQYFRLNSRFLLTGQASQAVQIRKMLRFALVPTMMEGTKTGGAFATLLCKVALMLSEVNVRTFLVTVEVANF